MRKCLFLLSCCLLLLCCASALAEPQDYALEYNAVLPAGPVGPASLLTLATEELPPTPQKDDSAGLPLPTDVSPVVEALQFPNPVDVRPVANSLLPSMNLAGGSVSGLAPGFTTLWRGGLQASMLPEQPTDTLLTGSLVLTGSFLPGTPAQGPASGSIVPAQLDTAVQSLLSASLLPYAEHTLLLANQSEMNLVADVSADPLVFLETRGNVANLFLDEGSTFKLSGPVSLSDGPLSTLSLSNGATMHLDYTPSEWLPNALPLPASLRLAEGATLGIVLQNPMQPETADVGAPVFMPGMMALSSAGANQISMASGSTLSLQNNATHGRLFSPPQAGNGGTLEIITEKLTLTRANKQKIVWDNGNTPFTLALDFDPMGNIICSTIGYHGVKPKTTGLTLDSLTGLSASRRVIPEKEPEDTEDDEEFNGWSISVYHLYEEGGRWIPIPQKHSHTVVWASKTGQDLTIPVGNFLGFAPVESKHVLKNVRKHGSYDIHYQRTTVTRTATIRLDTTGLDPAAIQNLRAAARGTVRLHQSGSYQQIPFAMPANANSTTVSGQVYAYTPSGGVLNYNFTMPAPTGLTVVKSGDTFTLSLTAPPQTNVQVNLSYLYSNDNGGSYPIANVIPNQATQATVPAGQNLSGNTAIQPALTGLTFDKVIRADGAAPVAAQGDTFYVCYKRNTIAVKGTVRLTGPGGGVPDPTSIPDPIKSNLGTYFTFSLTLAEGTATPNLSTDDATVSVIANFGTPFTHQVSTQQADGSATANLGDMTCTPSWGGPTQLTANGGDYTGTAVLPGPYTVIVTHTAEGTDITPAGSNLTGYFQETVHPQPLAWSGLTVKEAPPYNAGPLTADNTPFPFTYDRAKEQAKISVTFLPGDIRPGGYNQKLAVTVTTNAGTAEQQQEVVEVTIPEQEPSPAYTGVSTLSFYTNLLTADPNECPVTVTVGNLNGYGNTETDRKITVNAINDITIEYLVIYDPAITYP